MKEIKDEEDERIQTTTGSLSMVEAFLKVKTGKMA
jgi:hypothetical protein